MYGQSRNDIYEFRSSFLSNDICECRSPFLSLGGSGWLVIVLVLIVCNQAAAFCPKWFSGTFASNARGLRLQKSVVFKKMTISDATSDTQRILAKEAFLAAAKAGPKNGVGCTPEQREEIEGKLAILTAMNPTKVPPPSRRAWRCPLRSRFSVSAR
jgi:hypothetical protein